MEKLRRIKLITIRFILRTCLLLCIPALVYLISVARHDDLSLTYLTRYFLGNYGYMAAPHLLTVIFGIAAEARRSAILGTLVVLNVLLFAFQLWVWFIVPVGESGLAWIFYLPVWGVALLTLPFFFAWLGERARAD